MSEPLGKDGADRRLREAQTARRPMEPDWYLNLAFFQGQQWVAADRSGRLYQPNLGDLDPVTDNRVQPIIRTEVARMTKSRPSYAVTPRDMDDQSVNDAAAATRLLEWGWDEFGLAEKRRDAILWARVCGAGFIKTVWDPTVGSGTEVLVDGGGKAVSRPDGKPGVVKRGEFGGLEDIEGVQSKVIGKGEVRHTVRAPFDIYPDPLAQSLDEARWLVDETVRSPEYVKERYGVDVVPDAPSQSGIVETRLHSSQLDASTGQKLGVRVFELWERPSQTVPQGRHVVWCEQALLHEGPNDYGCLPYAMFPGVAVPGRFWPDAVTTHLRPIQVQRNKLLTQIRANVERFGNPTLLMDALSGNEYYGVPGEIIRHNAASPFQLPQFLQPPQLPAHVFNLLQEMDAAMREIAGQYEVSQGTVPTGVTAASAISLLQEQDATRIGPDVEVTELALSEVGQHTLALQVKYYTVERTIAIIGEEGVVDVDVFRARAGAPVPSVRVVAHSTFPRSLAARQAAIRDTLNLLLQYGVPIDASALARTLRDFQVGGLERLVQSYTIDVNQVTRENVEFLRGAPIEVRKTDNDAIHIQGHEDWTKTQRFRELPEDRQAEYMAHIDQHYAQQQQEQQQQVPAAPPSPGAVPTEPPPPLPGLPIGPSTVPTEASGNPMPPLGDPIAPDPTL